VQFIRFSLRLSFSRKMILVLTTRYCARNNPFVYFQWQTNRGKPLIRITSDTDMTTRVASGSSGKDPELSPKRPTPTLTITIPSNEEEIRSLSSPDSASPLLSSAQDSGGSSPQRPKVRQDIPSPREFKRQVG